jgi:hypothetical protein
MWNNEDAKCTLSYFAFRKDIPTVHPRRISPAQNFSSVTPSPQRSKQMEETHFVQDVC